MSDLTLSHGTAVSPFDAIRRVNEIGVEYWSGRDMMTPLGYDKWQNFTSAVNRAKLACINVGRRVDDEFAQVSKLIDAGKLGTVEREDINFTRFGAYLTAMNGDPRKNEIAAAQAYFTIRTREAEVAKPKTMSLVDRLAIGMEAYQEAIAEKDREIAVLAPKAEFADMFLDANGDLAVGDAANELTRAGVNIGRNRLFKEMADMRWIFKSGGGWSPYQRIVESGYLSVMLQSYANTKTGERTVAKPSIRVTPKGLRKLASVMTVQALELTA